MQHPTELSKLAVLIPRWANCSRELLPYLSHPLLWHSCLWPHFSLCNNTYDTYIRWCSTPDSPSGDAIIWCFIPSEIILSFSVAGAAYLEKKILFLKQGSCSLFDLHIYGRFVIGWGVVGAHSSAELLTVSRIQKQCRRICYQSLLRECPHMPIAICSLIRGL